MKKQDNFDKITIFLFIILSVLIVIDMWTSPKEGFEDKLRPSIEKCKDNKDSYIVDSAFGRIKINCGSEDVQFSE